VVAKELGLPTDPQTLADPSVRLAIARRLAHIAVDYILDAPRDRLGTSLLLTESLPRGATPTALTFSGGVSEYIFSHEDREFGDIAMLLARELTAELGRRASLPLVDPGQGIRATVIGASQFTVQVSGKTIFLSDPSILPVHNIPVVHVGRAAEVDPNALTEAIRNGLKQMDLEPQARLAIAFSWRGDPEYKRLAAVGRAIVAAAAPGGKRREPLFLMIDGDIGKTLGQLLHYELDLPSAVVSIDGVQLQDLDYVDVGEIISPPGVVPVVIKSLLFS
jgi:ethanolamine utilization protein EutA